MISGTYIHIRSDRFPKAEGEDQELVNPDTHGKSFALYLQAKLKGLKYDAPFVCCEDWGWWVEIRGLGFPQGLCVYAREDDDGHLRDFVCCSAVEEKRKFVWSKLKTVDCETAVRQLMDNIDTVLRHEEGVEVIERMTSRSESASSLAHDPGEADRGVSGKPTVIAFGTAQ